VYRASYVKTQSAMVFFQIVPLLRRRHRGTRQRRLHRPVCWCQERGLPHPRHRLLEKHPARSRWQSA